MAVNETRIKAKEVATSRAARLINRPKNHQGKFLKMSEYYGEYVFDVCKVQEIPEEVRKQILEVSLSGKKLLKEHAAIIAKAVLNWANSHGATHFCHWFQPLTGSTAEKHDSFLDIDKNNKPIEDFSAAQLMQGEPDASSFPHGGSRSTFEARGYTAWDMSSPIFLLEGVNGKTICIPTAFVSYYGDALDIKTPLLRSVSKLCENATKFMNLTGHKEVKKVTVTCGAEQEYFLIDQALYFSRPDLVMTGRCVFGAPSSKNQQLSDHYFGAIPDRVLSFMEELDLELHRLGIPAKTRHNEVAPGQFELAQIFREGNVSADNNQLVMATIKTVAGRHNFKALLHEKPFAGINGSGKHLNWSMATDTDMNLLGPGKELHKNVSFLTVTSIVVEAVYRHSKMLRMAIASAGNDHRLGANEAPPSIISVFLGDTLNRVLQAIKEGKDFRAKDVVELELGASQLANLPQDNTDRNRTSPFAFTGNKFEFRAVGSAASIGMPLSILNAAVASVFEEANEFIEAEIKKGTSIDDAQLALSKKLLNNSWSVIFNGDGYSHEWVVEAEKRGLPNFKTTADSLAVLEDENETKFLTSQGIYSASELKTRHNVILESYNTVREIEFDTLISLVNGHVISSALQYKKDLFKVMKGQKKFDIDSPVEMDISKKLNSSLQSLYESVGALKKGVEELSGSDQDKAIRIAKELFPLSEVVAGHANDLEKMIPDEYWGLPTFFELLFLR